MSRNTNVLLCVLDSGSRVKLQMGVAHRLEKTALQSTVLYLFENVRTV